MGEHFIPDVKYENDKCPKCGEELEICAAWVVAYGHRIHCDGWIHTVTKGFVHVDQCKGAPKLRKLGRVVMQQFAKLYNP